MCNSTSNSLQPKSFVYIDNSNLFLEGQRRSAVQTGIGGVRTIADAIKANVLDFSWRPKYSAFSSFFCGNGFEFAGGGIWGSVGPGHSLEQIARLSGMPVFAVDRNSRGKEKGVDTAIVMALMKHVYTGLIRPGVDDVTLVTGDADFTPAVVDVRGAGINVDVAFWSHASKDLAAAASRFVCLDPFFDFLSYRPTHSGTRSKESR